MYALIEKLLKNIHQSLPRKGKIGYIGHKSLVIKIKKMEERQKAIKSGCFRS